MRSSRGRMANASRSGSGFALIIVLWSTALLAVIAGSFAFGMRLETSLTNNLIARAQGEALADAGIQRGILALLEPDTALRWKADGSVHEVPFGAGTLRISIRAENGKIDLNRAPDELIRGLFRTIDDDADTAELSDAVLDWRDRDSETRPNGAEDDEYTAAGRAYGARDGAFLSVGELSQVRGLDADVVRHLSEFVTVYSGRPRLDPLTASREALLAIPDIDEESVDRFLEEREVRAQEGLPFTPIEQLASGRRYLATTKATVYTVEAEGRTTDGVVVNRTAVVRVSRSRKRPYLILSWSRGSSIDSTASTSDQSVSTEGADGSEE